MILTLDNYHLLKAGDRLKFVLTSCSGRMYHECWIDVKVVRTKRAYKFSYEWNKYKGKKLTISTWDVESGPWDCWEWIPSGGGWFNIWLPYYDS